MPPAARRFAPVSPARAPENIVFSTPALKSKCGQLTTVLATTTDTSRTSVRRLMPRDSKDRKDSGDSVAKDCGCIVNAALGTTPPALENRRFRAGMAKHEPTGGHRIVVFPLAIHGHFLVAADTGGGRELNSRCNEGARQLTLPQTRRSKYQLSDFADTLASTQTVFSWVSHGAPVLPLLSWVSPWLPAEPDVRLSPHPALHASLPGGGAEVQGLLIPRIRDVLAAVTVACDCDR